MFFGIGFCFMDNFHMEFGEFKESQKQQKPVQLGTQTSDLLCEHFALHEQWTLNKLFFFFGLECCNVCCMCLDTLVTWGMAKGKEIWFALISFSHWLICLMHAMVMKPILVSCLVSCIVHLQFTYAHYFRLSSCISH